MAGGWRGRKLTADLESSDVQLVPGTRKGEEKRVDIFMWRMNIYRKVYIHVEDVIPEARLEMSLRYAWQNVKKVTIFPS